MDEKFHEDDFKMFEPRPIRDKLVVAGIILLGIGLFIGVVCGSMYLAHEATMAVTQSFGLPPPPH